VRVFLTGASGFIGSHVTRALLTAGYEVAILARPNRPVPRLHDVVPQLTIIEGDFYDTNSFHLALAKWQPEACIHLAWYAEPGKYLQSPENILALTASLTLLDGLIRVGCKQVVMAGTCAEYDTDLGFLREDSQTYPTSLYAATKLSLSLIAQQVAAINDIRFAWARVFYLYGPYENDQRMTPALIRALLTNQPFPATLGEQVRDYLHVSDVASALITLVDRHANGVFNIASGSPVTMRQLMEIIGEITGQLDLIQFGALPYRVWEPMFICGDSQRLKALGWAPRYSLRDGLRQTVGWWRQCSQ